MRRLSASLGLGAMLLALVTGPLFHLHDDDHHDSRKSVVHAHFLDTEHSEPHSDVEITAEDSHKNARWVDFFIIDSPVAGLDLAIDLIDTSPVIVLAQSRTIAILETPRAHGPPDGPLTSPRSPPST